MVSPLWVAEYGREDVVGIVDKDRIVFECNRVLHSSECVALSRRSGCGSDKNAFKYLSVVTIWIPFSILALLLALKSLNK